MPLERVSTTDGIWFHNETIILFHTASVLTSRNTKRSCFFHIAISIWSSFFLKPFNSFHIQREHSNISQLTIFKDLHFSNMIWMCFFSIASNYDEPIVNADFNNIFMYIYIHIWVHIRLSQKMTPLKFLKSKPMWYLRASWTTNLKISRRVFFLGHREEKDVLIQM